MSVCVFLACGVQADDESEAASRAAGVQEGAQVCLEAATACFADAQEVDDLEDCADELDDCIDEIEDGEEDGEEDGGDEEPEDSAGEDEGDEGDEEDEEDEEDEGDEGDEEDEEDEEDEDGPDDCLGTSLRFSDSNLTQIECVDIGGSIECVCSEFEDPDGDGMFDPVPFNSTVVADCAALGDLDGYSRCEDLGW